MGYDDFFLSKSPFTVLYIAGIMLAFYNLLNSQNLIFFATCFTTGMIVEWIGVHTGQLFGSYYYGDNLGIKVDGVPILIGINWGVLSLVTFTISQQLTGLNYLKPLIAAALMVGLDFLLEQVCSYAGFWYFENGAGWYNYCCWFVIALGLQLLAPIFKVLGDLKTATHVYIVQLIFSFGLWMIILT